MTLHSPLSGHAQGLPQTRLAEIFDMVTLALDATEGGDPRHWQMPKARSYLRSALRQTDKLLKAVAS